jgi:hypothetical protein
MEVSDMKARSLVVPAALAVLGVAGCGDNAGPAARGTPTPNVVTPATTPSAAPVSPAPSGGPACVTGTWRATGVQSRNGFGTITGRVAGGAGVTMAVGADGTTDVGFQQSQPMTFTAEAAGATVRGQVKYSGSLHGTVHFTSTSPGTGQWQPQAGATGDELRATVKLIDPVSVTLLDDAGIGDLSGAENALDVLPILRGGTYQCDATSLRVHTERDGPALIWTFARSS